MPALHKRVSSGVPTLDRFLGSLAIGENVLWYDEAGSLAFPFCRHLIEDSAARKKAVVFVSFDRSPKNLLDKLEDLAESQHLTILDCFTNGKGDGSEIFAAFFEKQESQGASRVIRVSRPADPRQVAEAVYRLHQSLSGDVRFIFESLTGMQAVWGSEERITDFYTRSCPKLYELETIAYWIVEKGAHSDRLKASINQIAQVVVDLSVQRGHPALTLLKAEKRRSDRLNAPHPFWSDGRRVSFDGDRLAPSGLDLGGRIKHFRSALGLSQKDLAGLAEVTPSTISQVESNTIHPSIPALFRIAEALSIDMAAFFKHGRERESAQVFPAGSGSPLTFKDLPRDAVQGVRLIPPDLETAVRPFLLEIAPERSVAGHFFAHKGEEMGYLLTGRLQMRIGHAVYHLSIGDTACLQGEMPSHWSNPGPEPATLLWLLLSRSLKR